ncbi:DUF5623 domain-containing protein [Pusillimonas sp. DMV24BSW_D]|uniref:DUF5623 domain-containing protein n=1 Tax=Neopusillimonas aestuarii TaxID=2716226 RepID=UPI00140AA19E|nr:DUF5623 domain-containing protein [Pusillimonas sp. DMV24BSW_D]QIM50238.1 DUF5623 domain-containing protein [Pusillimonas sp. DMV24BSW_D]
MNIASIRPSSVDGIKQLAKKICREHNIPHTRALDEASRQAGFANFVHAKRNLARKVESERFPVFLSVHWYAPRPRRGERRPGEIWAGREIFSVNLSRPLPDIVAKHRVGRGRGLHGFRMEYEDHLEYRTNVDGQNVARERLLSAVRSLRFMEATGLQPVSTKRYDAIEQALTKLPGRDHMSDWFVPATESYVCLDEPYARAIENRTAERERWLERNGLKMIMPPGWEGIYYAGECTPCLISPDGALLHRVAGALAKIKAIIKPEPWPHETGICNDDFVSPKRQADAKPRRRRPGPSWGERNGATPYGGQPGIPSSWRPAKAMPFDLHQQLGPLVQGLASSTIFSRRVHRNLSSARSDLEDWSLMEHKDQLGDDAYDIYYGGRMIVGNSEAELVEMLSMAQAIVERGYADCKPRRQLLAVFEAAVSELANSRSKSIGVGSSVQSAQAAT